MWRERGRCFAGRWHSRATRMHVTRTGRRTVDFDGADGRARRRGVQARMKGYRLKVRSGGGAFLRERKRIEECVSLMLAGA